MILAIKCFFRSFREALADNKGARRRAALEQELQYLGNKRSKILQEMKDVTKRLESLKEDE